MECLGIITISFSSQAQVHTEGGQSVPVRTADEFNHQKLYQLRSGLIQLRVHESTGKNQLIGVHLW